MNARIANKIVTSPRYALAWTGDDPLGEYVMTPKAKKYIKAYRKVETLTRRHYRNMARKAEYPWNKYYAHKAEEPYLMDDILGF